MPGLNNIATQATQSFKSFNKRVNKFNEIKGEAAFKTLESLSSKGHKIQFITHTDGSLQKKYLNGPKKGQTRKYSFDTENHIFTKKSFDKAGKVIDVVKQELKKIGDQLFEFTERGLKENKKTTLQRIKKHDFNLKESTFEDIKDQAAFAEIDSFSSKGDRIKLKSEKGSVIKEYLEGPKKGQERIYSLDKDNSAFTKTSIDKSGKEISKIKKGTANIDGTVYHYKETYTPEKLSTRHTRKSRHDKTRQRFISLKDQAPFNTKKFNSSTGKEIELKHKKDGSIEKKYLSGSSKAGETRTYEKESSGYDFYYVKKYRSPEGDLVKKKVVAPTSLTVTEYKKVQPKAHK